MFRISLRELFALVGVVALVIVSLKYASETWLAVNLALAMLTYFCAIVVAGVDRGPRQAFAIAFVLVTTMYGLMVLNMPRAYPHPEQTWSLEFDQWEGRLPTTRLMRYVHRLVDRSQWVDNSGKVIASFDPKQPTPPASPGAGLREIPPRQQFMPIAHLWWGLLFGYIGGHFARFIYLRRTKDDPLSGRK